MYIRVMCISVMRFRMNGMQRRRKRRQPHDRGLRKIVDGEFLQ